MTLSQNNLVAKISIDVSANGTASVAVSFPKEGELGAHKVTPIIKTYSIPDITKENCTDPALLALDKKMYKITEKWDSVARERNHRAKQVTTLPEEKQQLAKDSELVCENLQDMFECDDFSGNYLAIDATTNKVEGVAAIAFDEEDAEKLVERKVILKLIGSKPTNVALFPEDKPLRGVGTALLAHIFSDLQGGAWKNARLTARATKSATGFYEKAGFVPTGEGMPFFIYDVPANEIAKYEALGCVAGRKKSNGSATMKISNHELNRLNDEAREIIVSYPSRFCLDVYEDSEDVPMAITPEKREEFLKAHPLNKLQTLDIGSLK